MKVAAVIAEYNPFHNGHKYHIEKTKELTGADYIIAIISGNYVQRGTPAIIDKYSRTKMALSNGVDLVIELPTCYATASAEYFAYGAVSILNQLGVVDYLCFGSECADIDTLHYIANILVKNPPEFSRILNSYLREGKSFPKARHLALIEYLSNKTELIDIDKLNAVLDVQSIVYNNSIRDDVVRKNVSNILLNAKLCDESTKAELEEEIAKLKETIAKEAENVNKTVEVVEDKVKKVTVPKKSVRRY